ncbi:FliG C-terminal domain-containing protein [Microbacteriaceae bacterium 4G12]
MNDFDMNKYRITFISPHGLEQRTIMAANNLPDLMKKVENIIHDPAGYFIHDKKNNCYFKVLKENIAYIQYELLFSDKEINIEKIKTLPITVLVDVCKQMQNEELYALALLEMDEETKDKLLHAMDHDLHTKVKQIMSQQQEASSMEIYEAQDLLLDAIIQTIQQSKSS